jgi:phosphopantothenoylcysteine decarboxylase/phosphopantothenate--cysteine ligase
MTVLTGKKILVGVTGGIAAYKSPDLVRRFLEEGAEVRVVMTHSAQKLVSAAVFQAVSGQPVRCDLWDDEAEAAMGHIELARWADAVVIAPATANVLADLSAGRAGDLLTTLCLVTTAPLAVVPAMNHSMWSHAATQSNCAVLAARGVRFIGPDSGDQACGETGAGRMVEPVQIVTAVAELLAPPGDGALAGRRILVTAGPTREAIDPVRFVSNRSSGKMGFAVAEAAVEAGARVTLIAGPVNLPTPKGVERVDVETARQMHDATLERAADADIYIGAAAISDYRPEHAPDQKIKKKTDTLGLNLVKCPDVLAAVSALPRRPFSVGFAAETEKLEEHALAKLRAKNLDMIIANLVGEKLGFDRDDNSALVLWPGGRADLGRTSKRSLAREILGLIAERFSGSKSGATPMRRRAPSSKAS